MQTQVANYMGLMIDTLEYAKRLEEGGIKREAAEWQARALAEALEHAGQNHLTTKEDLRLLKSDLDQRLEKIDQRFDLERSLTNEALMKLENRLTLRMFYMTASTITLLGGLMTILHFY